MRVLTTALLVVAAATTASAAVVNAPAALTVDGRACRGVEIGGLGSKFGYDVRLTSFEAGPFCSRSMVKCVDWWGVGREGGEEARVFGVVDGKHGGPFGG